MDNQKKERLLKRYSSSFSSKMPSGGNRGPGGGPGRGRMMGKGGKPKNTSATVKRLFSYIACDKHKIILAFIFVLISSASTLAGSYMLRPIINNYIVPGNIKGLVGALCLMALIYLAGVLTSYFQAKIMVGISQRALCRIREELFGKMQNLPVGFFDRNASGELMSRFTNDVDTVGEMLNHTIVQLFSGIITIIGTFSLMIYTNWKLAIITIVMIPVFARTAASLAKRSRKFFSAQQAALGAVNGYIEETVSGQKVVKVFNHEHQACEEFGILNEELRSRQVKAQFFGSMMGPIMGNLSQVNYALTATVGGLMCILGGFDVGGLAVFVNYSRQFSRPINEISMQVTNIFSALSGAERVFAVMDEEPEADMTEKPSIGDVQGKIELKNVTFGYTPEKVILKDINLVAQKGQKIAFVGSTGAGKTTITNLINRFYDIDTGSILIDGTDIREYNKPSLRANIAMVLQDTHLFTGTVRENIRYGRLDATDEEVIEAAKTASAHSFIMRLPKGYDTVLEGDGANLSQGQRQLLNIARASISKAPILILDEATSSVDTRTEKHIEHGMDRLMKNRTTFIIAHRLSTIRNADTILVLEQGEVIERGSHDELLEQKGRYYQLYTGAVELD
ncbi:MAG: ABC transporter ATP-binding protein [Ruminococcaceae bacterium]|nr:ABC transporter ATP-binding protein [Oscillospiraceae bacterium]